MPEKVCILKKLYNYHQDWYKIAYSFLQNKEDAEDLVQELYLRIRKYNVKHKNIKYKNEVNRYFIYLTIRNMALHFINKKAKEQQIYQLPITERDEQYHTMDQLYKKIENEVKSWHHYDRLLFELYMFSGLSYRDMANGTDKKARAISNEKEFRQNALKNGNKISVRSMHNTIRNCKRRLKKKLGEDFENYFKAEYHKII